MTLRKTLVFTVALLFILTMAAPSLRAQSLTTGEIAGTVTDPTGAVVPGATITLKNNDQGTTQTRTTSNTGAYRFALLQPGSYTMTISSPNLQTTQRNVRVNVGQATTLNAQMALAAAQEAVTVTAEGALVQAQNPNISTTMSHDQVAYVPNGGNDLSYVAQTAPGAAMNTQSGFGNFSTFGLPANSNNFTYNGMRSNDPFLNLNNSGATNIQLGLNDIQEATVINNGYEGQYGGLAGSQVNYVSKSGSNSFHGNANYYWNGRLMNANNYFNKQETPVAKRSFVNANQWSGSFGGPIKKDKQFFFVDTEGLRVIIPVTQKVNVPTDAFEAATLSHLAGTPAESFYRNMFNLYNAAPGRASAQNILANGGCKEFAGTLGFGAGNPCALQFNSTVGALTHEWLLMGRYDVNIRSNDKLYLHVRTDQGHQASYTDPISPLFNITSDQPQWEGQLSETHTFGPSTVNNLILAGSYYRAIFTQPNRSQMLSTQPIQVRFNARNGTFYELGSHQFPFPTPQGRNTTQYQIIDDIAHTMGNHQLKFGVNFQRVNATVFDVGENSAGAVVGETLTDFFNGVATSYQQNFPTRQSQPLATYSLGVYIQDGWRVSPRLRLTMALRADRYGNPTCRTNCFNRLTGPFEQVAHNVTTPYNQVIRTGLSEAYPNLQSVSIQPRFGFALSPFGSGKNTVIRGGFGLFSDQPPGNTLDPLMTNLPGAPQFITTGLPLTPTVSGSSTVAAAAADAVFRTQFANGGTLASISDALTAAGSSFSAPSYFTTIGKIKYGRFQQWNLEFQQGIGQKMVFNLNYVGNHGIFEPLQFVDQNAYCGAVSITPGSPSCLATLASLGVGPVGNSFAGLPALPPDARFGQITQTTNAGVSNYNGVTASLSRRFSQFQLQLNYTWSHALDLSSNNGNPNTPFNFGTNTSIAFPQSSNNIKGFNYGNSDYDVRHYVSLNYVWNTPRKGPHGILGGWTIAGTAFARTGMPFTVIDGGVGGVLNGFNYAGSGNIYANNLNSGPVHCGRSAASPTNTCTAISNNFTPATTGFGQQRRNQVYGPNFANTDLTVTRNFKIPGWEGSTFTVGAQAFNVLNHPNFDQPVADVASSDNGRIVRTVNPPTSIYGAFLGADSSPRTVQIIGRFTF